MTGGLIAGAITAVPGASEVLSLGLCTYSNVMKQRFLGVSDRTLAAHTEISAPCAREMARGAAALSGADLAVSVTGLAGARTWKTPLLRGRPDDGTVFVGVWFGGRAKAYGFRFSGTREAVPGGKPSVRRWRSPPLAWRAAGRSLREGILRALPAVLVMGKDRQERKRMCFSAFSCRSEAAENGYGMIGFAHVCGAPNRKSASGRFPVCRKQNRRPTPLCGVGRQTVKKVRLGLCPKPHSGNFLEKVP